MEEEYPVISEIAWPVIPGKIYIFIQNKQCEEALTLKYAVMKNLMIFLRELQLHNEREWFNSHKQSYQQSRATFLSLVEQVIGILQQTDIRLQGLEAKETVFRVNRDVRFSNDKSPYKTHFGAYMASGGKKSRDAGYYLHVSPEEIFIAAGVFQPDKDQLLTIRQEIIFQPDIYTALFNEMKEKGYTPMENDKLKIGPKGFPSDSPHLELIKYKHYIMSRHLTEQQLYSPKAAGLIAQHFADLFPYTYFLNHAMMFHGNE